MRLASIISGIAALALVSSAASAALVEYNYNTSTTTPNLAPALVASGLTASNVAPGDADITFEVQPGAPGAGSGLKALGITATTAAASVTNNDYFAVTFTPAGGTTVNFTSFSTFLQNGGGNARTFFLRSSFDNYTANLGTTAVGGGNTITVPYTFNVVATAATPVTFRFYQFSDGNPARTLVFDNTSFDGTLVAAPEPASLALLGLGGLAGLRRRR